MNKVILYYNPYIPELKIVLNGKRISQYSALMSFAHRKFSEWCDMLFPELYREINSEYELTCVADPFIAACIADLAKNDRYCISCERQSFSVSDSLFERMERLELYSFEESTDNKVIALLSSSDESRAYTLLDRITSAGVAERTGEETAICTLSTINTPEFCICSKSDIPYNAAAVIVAGEDEYCDISLFTDAPVYYIFPNCDATVFCGKSNGYMSFGVKAEEEGNLIFDIICEEIFCSVLSEYAYRLTSDDADYLTPQEKLSIRSICNTSAQCVVNIPASAESGRVYELTAEIYPSYFDSEIFVESDNPDVIEVSGTMLTAREPGIAVISIFIDDDPYPVAVKSITVSRHNNITGISLFPSELYMPCDSSEKLQVSVVPDNADNRNEMKWESTDTFVADAGDGTVYSHNVGVCSVRVSTPECEASITVHVEPRMTKLSWPLPFISLKVDEQKECRFTVEPENAFGRSALRVLSSDPSVAEYRGGYIIGKRKGECRLFVKNMDSTLSSDITVKVEKKGWF